MSPTNPLMLKKQVHIILLRLRHNITTEKVAEFLNNKDIEYEGYYVNTVGLNEATIAKYIPEQVKSDQMMDKLQYRNY